MTHRRCLLLMLLAAVTSSSVAEEVTTPEPATPAVLFTPGNLLKMPLDDVYDVVWTTTLLDVSQVVINVTDESVITVLVESEVIGIFDGTNVTYSGTFNVSADFIGVSTITVQLLDAQDKVLGTGELEASVILRYQKLVSIFSTSLGVLVALVNVTIGSTINLELVKNIIKRPVGPIVGLFCQYVCMPLVAFGLSQTVFAGTPVFQLAVFLTGCCPGGGQSNMWTHLLGGNLDMSIVMTFVSTIMAFVALPAWVLLLGPVIVRGATFTIPFGDIAMLLVTLIGPCFIGLLIQRFLPRISEYVKMGLTPFSIFVLLYTIAFGCASYRYIFSVMNTKIILGSLALPFIGYFLGLILGLVFRQPRKDAVAISIETGIQNNTIAIFMLNVTLVAPLSTLGIVIPATVFLFTPIPLVIVGFGRLGYRYYRARKSGKVDMAMDNVEAEQNGKPDTIVATVSSRSPVAAPGSQVEAPHKNGIDNPAADLSDNPT